MKKILALFVMTLLLAPASQGLAIPPNSSYQGEIELHAPIHNLFQHPGASAAPLEFAVFLHYTSTRVCTDLVTRRTTSRTTPEMLGLRMREGVKPYRYVQYLREDRVECGDGFCMCVTSNTPIENITTRFSREGAMFTESDPVYQDLYFQILGSSWETVPPGPRKKVEVRLAYQPPGLHSFSTDLTVRPHAYAGPSGPRLGPLLESQLNFHLEPYPRIEGKREIWRTLAPLWNLKRTGKVRILGVNVDYRLSNLRFENFVFTPRALDLVHDPQTGNLQISFRAYVAAWLTFHAFADLPSPIPNLGSDVSVSAVFRDAAFSATLTPDGKGGYLLTNPVFTDNMIFNVSISNPLLDIIVRDIFKFDRQLRDWARGFIEGNTQAFADAASKGLTGNQALYALATVLNPEIHVSVNNRAVRGDIRVSLLNGGGYPDFPPAPNPGLKFGYKMVDGHLLKAFRSMHPNDPFQRLSRTAQEVAAGGGQFFVLNIPWREVEPVLLPQGLPFADYRDAIWPNLRLYETFIDNLLARGIVPVVAVGEGKEVSVPSLPDGRKVRPSAVNVLDPGDPYNTLGRDAYLASLRRHVKAVTSLLDRRVVYWGVENELNAANRLNNKRSIGRENGPFDANSRCGSLWSNADGTGLGPGVDEVFSTVVAALREGRTLAGAAPPLAHHQFESFEQTERKILDWLGALDLVGINVFVNTPASEHRPGTGLNEPMGFMAGEYVYAVKRLLRAAGRPDVKVWVTSTTYPVFQACDKAYLQFTYDRQAAYASQAVQSLRAYGAEALIWNYFVLDEADLPEACSSLFNATGATVISGSQGAAYTDAYWLLRNAFPRNAGNQEIPAASPAGKLR